MAELYDYLKEEAENPQWDKAGKVHDWRNHIPDEVREIWETFTVQQRLVLTAWADELAGREHWD